MAAPIRAWGDYFIPGTSVLRNKLGATDAATLQSKEEFVTMVRASQLSLHPIAGAFDYDHMKAIHGYLFQDVYEWAGQERVGPDGGAWMSKAGPDVVRFAPGDPNAPMIDYRYYPGAGIADAAVDA